MNPIQRMTARIVIVVFMTCLAAMAAVGCGDSSPRDDRISWDTHTLYLNGIIYETSDKRTITRRTDGSDESDVIFSADSQTDGNAEIESVGSITEYEGKLYFLYEVPDIYSSPARIGRVGTDGSELELNIAENLINIRVTSPFEAVGDSFIIGGDGFYSLTYLYDPSFSEMREYFMEYCCVCNDYIYMIDYSKEQLCRMKSGDSETEPVYNFSGLMSAVFADGGGGMIDRDTVTVSGDGTVYMYIRNISSKKSLPNIIYSVDASTVDASTVDASAVAASTAAVESGEATAVYEHNNVLTRIVCCGNNVYFSDSTAVYRLDTESGTATLVFDSSETAS